MAQNEGRTQRVRNFTLTLNNYTATELAALDAFGVNPQVKYIVRGLEVGEQGTPHIQGYIQFHNAKTFAQVVAFLNNPRYHIEVAAGNFAQNLAYCTKDGNFAEFGERPVQGRRNDLEVVKTMVRERRSMRDIAEVATSYQSLRFAECYVKYQPLVERPAPLVKWFHGPTGCGKTRMAYHQLGYATTWVSGIDLKWFDGYDGQPNVILDDFRPSHIQFSFLLRLLDRYPLKVPVKNGYANWQPRVIIITSPQAPDATYHSEFIQENINQLLRRITEIREFRILDETLYTIEDAAQNIPQETIIPPQGSPPPPQDVQA